MKKFIRWFEIPALDLKRAVTFYESVFGEKLQSVDCGNEKMAFFPEDERNVTGMISQAPGFVPSSDGPVIYFNATVHMDRIIQKTLESGGRVLTAKTKIEAENRGYFALLADTEGNRIGLYAD